MNCAALETCDELAKVVDVTYVGGLDERYVAGPVDDLDIIFFYDVCDEVDVRHRNLLARLEN